MITHDQSTLELFGTPPFTIVIGLVLLAAVGGLVFGVRRWRQRSGKIVFVASASILLLLALAAVLVLITVASGSMG